MRSEQLQVTGKVVFSPPPLGQRHRIWPYRPQCEPAFRFNQKRCTEPHPVRSSISVGTILEAKIFLVIPLADKHTSPMNRRPARHLTPALKLFAFR